MFFIDECNLKMEANLYKVQPGEGLRDACDMTSVLINPMICKVDPENLCVYVRSIWDVLDQGIQRVREEENYSFIVHYFGEENNHSEEWSSIPKKERVHYV